MAGESLRDELLALPGVADAEVDESGETPSGVRVKLSPDADARRVGVEVQRVLAAHGLRSRVSGSDDELPAPPDEPPPVPILGLPPVGDESPDFFGDRAEPMAEPPRDLPPISDEPPATTPPPFTPAQAVSDGLAAVRLEESRDGVIATAVGSDGRALSERAAATPEALITAVVIAVGTLADGQAPKLLAFERTQTDGTEAITVILERADGWRGAGAAVVRASRAFAVGRATWSALRSD